MPNRWVKQPPTRLGWRDYYQIVTSFLMPVLGVMILARSKFAVSYLMPVLVGVAMTAFGLYRISFIIKYFRAKGARRDA